MTDYKEKRKDYNQAFPEPYNTIPPAVSEKKPGQLSEKQIRQFFEEVHCLIVFLSFSLSNH